MCRSMSSISIRSLGESLRKTPFGGTFCRPKSMPFVALEPIERAAAKKRMSNGGKGRWSSFPLLAWPVVWLVDKPPYF